MGRTLLVSNVGMEKASTPVPLNTPPPVAGQATVRPATVHDFIEGLKLPLDNPIIKSPPRLRVSRVPEENLVPRLSDRLAAKSVYREHVAAVVDCSASVAGDIRRRSRQSFPRHIPGTSVLFQAHGNAGSRELFPKAGGRRGRQTSMAL